MASSPGETSHVGSPTGLVSILESLNMLCGSEKRFKNTEPKSGNGRRGRAHSKSWVGSPASFLPPSLPLHPPHSIGQPFSAPPKVPLEPVIRILRTSDPSRHFVFQKHSVTSNIMVSHILHPEIPQYPQHPNPMFQDSHCFNRIPDSHLNVLSVEYP